VLAALLRALDRRCQQFLQAGPTPLLAEFQDRSSLARQRRVSVAGEASSFKGVTQGLDASGFLLVRREDTGVVEPVLAGTVRPAENE